MIDEIKSYLTCDCDLTKSIALRTVELQDLHNKKKISNEEYIELLGDLVSQKNVDMSLKQLAVKESLNKLINGLIAAASVV